MFRLTNSKNIALGTFILTLLFCITALTSSAKEPVLSPKQLASPPPKIIRTCCSFGSDVSMTGIPFVKYNDITCKQDIGPHQYMGSKEEANGNIYTEKGGFIDLGHVRDCADWTAYLSCYIIEEQKKGNEIEIVLGREGGLKTLYINLPNGFTKKQVYNLAGKITYDLSLWHEIATWFGVSYVPFVPERYSSFSPEDLYSNLLGINLGIEALNSEEEYEVAMTDLVSKTLKELKSVETLSATYEAMEKVESIWWTRKKKLPSKKMLIKRYFDKESSLLPWLIPNDNNAHTPHRIFKPDFFYSDFYELQIKLNYRFPVKAIFEIPNDRVITQNDFGVLQKHIQQSVFLLDQKIAFRAQRKEDRKKKSNKKTKSSFISPDIKKPSSYKNKMN